VGAGTVIVVIVVLAGLRARRMTNRGGNNKDEKASNLDHPTGTSSNVPSSAEWDERTRQQRDEVPDAAHPVDGGGGVSEA